MDLYRLGGVGCVCVGVSQTVVQCVGDDASVS